MTAPNGKAWRQVVTEYEADLGAAANREGRLAASRNWWRLVALLLGIVVVLRLVQP